MRKLIAVLLIFTLLAGCAAPVSGSADTAPAVTQQPTAAPAAPDADQLAVLQGFVDFAADTAGGSLKTAKASAALVLYLTEKDLPAEVILTWRAGLTEEEAQLLEGNGSGILRVARDIAADPAAQQELLADAGVETDFTALDMAGVAAKLDEVEKGLPQ